MAYCPHCSSSIADGAAYCVGCGALVAAQQPAPAPQSAVRPLPPSPPAFMSPGGATQDHDALAAFVGPNFDFYSRNWGQAPGSSAGLSWNWPSFFLGIGWLGYRKMYLYAGIYLGVSFLLNFLWYLFDISDAATLSIVLAASIAFGLLGNKLYHAHARDRSRDILVSAHPERVPLELSRAGGTNVAAGIGFLVAQVVIEFIQGMVLELILY